LVRKMLRSVAALTLLLGASGLESGERLGLCDCQWATVGYRPDQTEGVWGLSCNKEGFVLAGFEHAAQVQSDSSAHVPLSRGICCRPCLPSESAAQLAELDDDGASSGASDQQAEASLETTAAAAAAAAASPDSVVAVVSASCELAELEGAGLRCTAPGAAIQGFPQARSVGGGQQFYPVGSAQCCTPTLLYASGKTQPLEHCSCADAPSPGGISCGKVNSVGAAQAAGRVIRGFEHRLQDRVVHGSDWAIPEAPAECCDLCVSSVKPSDHPCEAMNFCNGHGVCSFDGFCRCEPGWGGEDCTEGTGGDDSYSLLSPRIFLFVLSFVACCACMSKFCEVGLTSSSRNGRNGGRGGSLAESLLGDARGRRGANGEWSSDGWSSGEVSLDLSGEDMEEETDEEEGSEHAGGGERQTELVAQLQNADDEQEEDEEEEEEHEAEAANAGEGLEVAVADDAAAEEEEEEEEEDRGAHGDDEAVELEDCAQGGRGAANNASVSAIASEACCVCLTARTQKVCLVPCGHTICRRCSKKLTRCPLCRRTIGRRQKLFVV